MTARAMMTQMSVAATQRKVQDQPPRPGVTEVPLSERARPPAWAICLVAAVLGLFIVAEPLAIDVEPGLQFFQGGVLLWFLVIFLLGSSLRRR
jgi:hypothetical protein